MEKGKEERKLKKGKRLNAMICRDRGKKRYKKKNNEKMGEKRREKK